MQKALLHSILQSYKEKQNHKLMSKMFYTMKNLHQALLEQRAKAQQKDQACRRMERFVRRQVKKRYRNGWKAIRGLIFVSDLGDEEVKSLMSSRLSVVASTRNIQ